MIDTDRRDELVERSSTSHFVRARRAGKKRQRHEAADA